MYPRLAVLMLILVGCSRTNDVTGPRLVAYRADLVKQRKRVQASGGKRGERRPTREPRSPHTVNGELRNIRALLGYVRKLGLLPHANLEDMMYGLERLRAGTNRVDYRKPHELQKLLEVALEHDEQMFDETPEEHAGDRPAGTRHAPSVSRFRRNFDACSQHSSSRAAARGPSSVSGATKRSQRRSGYAR